MESMERRRRMNCFKGEKNSSSRPVSRSNTYRRLSPIEASPSSSHSSLNITKCTGFVSQIGVPTQCNSCYMDISDHSRKNSSSSRSNSSIQRARARYYNIYPTESKIVTYKNEDYTYKSLPASPSANRKFSPASNGIIQRSSQPSSCSESSKIYRNFRSENGYVSLPSTPLDSRKTSPERKRSGHHQRSENGHRAPMSYSLRNCRSYSDMPSKLCPPFSRKHATIEEENQYNNNWESQSSRSYCSSIVSNSNNSSRAPSPMSVMSERCPVANGSLPRNFSYTQNEESKRRFIMNNFKSRSNESSHEGVVSTMKRRLSEKLTTADFERTVLKQYVRPSHEHLRVNRNTESLHGVGRTTEVVRSSRGNTAITSKKSGSPSSLSRMSSSGNSSLSSSNSNFNLDRYTSYRVVIDIIEAVMKDVVYETNSDKLLNNEGDKVSKSYLIESISKLDNLKDSPSVRNNLEKLLNEHQSSRGASHSKEVLSLNAPNLKHSSNQELEDILLQCTSKNSKDYSSLPYASKVAHKVCSKGKSRSSTPVIIRKDGRKKAIWQKQVSNVNSLKRDAEELKQRVKQLEELDSYAENIHDKEYAQLQVGYLKHEIKALENKLNDSDSKCFDLLEENVLLKTEIDSLVDEVDEVQDSFRDKDALEWKKLKAQLDVINKNCRNYQLKLRKAQLRTAELKVKNEELSASMKSEKAGTVTKFAIAVACLVAGYQIISKWK
ncbi:uncharacterized protein [Lepeophtheirus salmonis]|uniref:uncharacterized protein isoform X3 n=2 Tax=Lepeophtheirus salmonis TaxID=72036 RepID=UPI001AE4E027|nr:uncharacterized protein LOC121126222 isoform X3 [Lepeophtheirus salmonis]